MKKNNKGIIKIAAFAIVILGALFVARWYQLRFQANLRETVYVINTAEVAKNLLRGEKPEKLSVDLLRVKENEPVYQRGKNLYVGQGKERVEESFPFFVNDSNALMIMKDDALLLDTEFSEITTFQGMYVSDGLSFNYDKSQADEESFLFLKLNNGLFMNVQPILFSYPGGETKVRMNSIFYFEPTDVRYYAMQNNHSIQYGALPTVKMMTVTIGGKAYSYEQLLMNLGLWGDTKERKEKSEKKPEDELKPDILKPTQIDADDMGDAAELLAEKEEKEEVKSGEEDESVKKGEEEKKKDTDVESEKKKENKKNKNNSGNKKDKGNNKDQNSGSSGGSGSSNSGNGSNSSSGGAGDDNKPGQGGASAGDITGNDVNGGNTNPPGPIGDITGNDISGNDISGNDIVGDISGNIGWTGQFSHPTGFLYPFEADVYNISSTLEIKDPGGMMKRVMLELYWQPTGEDGKPAEESGNRDDYRLMYRKTFRSAGDIMIDNLPPGTWIYAKGIIYYTEDGEQKSFEFYDGFEQRVQTLGLECVDDLYLEFNDNLGTDITMLPNQIMISELGISGPNPNVIDKINKINITATATSEGVNKGKKYELQIGISEAKRKYYYKEEKTDRPLWTSDTGQQSLPSDTSYEYEIKLSDSFGNLFTHVVVGEYCAQDETIDWTENKSLNCCEKKGDSAYGEAIGQTWTARVKPRVTLTSKKFDDGKKNIDRIKYEIQLQDNDQSAKGKEADYNIQIFQETADGYKRVAFSATEKGAKVESLTLTPENVRGDRASYEIWGLTAGHVYEARIYGSYELRDNREYKDVLIGSQRFSTVSMASYGRVNYDLRSAHVKTEIWPNGERKEDGALSPYESATAQKLYISIKTGYGQTNQELVDLYMHHIDISVAETSGREILKASLNRTALESVEFSGQGSGKQNVFTLPAMETLIPDAVSGLKDGYLPTLQLEASGFPTDEKKTAWNLFQNGARLVLYFEDGSLDSKTGYQMNLATWARQGGEEHDVTGKSVAVRRLNYKTLKRMPYVTYSDILMASDYIRVFGMKFHDVDRAITGGTVDTSLVGIRTENRTLDYEYAEAGQEPADGYLKEITFDGLVKGVTYRINVAADSIRRDDQGSFVLRGESLWSSDFQAGDGLEGALVFESINYPLKDNGDGKVHVPGEYSLYNASGYFVGGINNATDVADTYGNRSYYWYTSPYIEVTPGDLYYLEGLRVSQNENSMIQFYVDDPARPGEKKIQGINTTTWAANTNTSGYFNIYGNTLFKIPEGVKYMRFSMYGEVDGIYCYATANCYAISAAKGVTKLTPAEQKTGSVGTNRSVLVYDNIKPGTRYGFVQKNFNYTYQFLDASNNPVGSAETPGWYGRSIEAPAGAARLQVTCNNNNSLTTFPAGFEAYEMDGEVLDWLHSRDLSKLSNAIRLEVKDKKNNLVGQDRKVYLRIYRGEGEDKTLLTGDDNPLPADVRDSLELTLVEDADGNLTTGDLSSLLSFFTGTDQTFTLELYVMYHGEEVELDTTTFRTDKVLEAIHDRTELAKTMRYPNGNFIVTDDIRLRDNEWFYAGNSNRPFTGHLDFQGHSLTKRANENSNYLVNVIGSGGIVENLVFNETVTGADRKAEIYYNGGVTSYNYGTIRNIVVNLDLGLGVWRKNYFGGICYENYGVIENFSVYFTPNSTKYVGYLFGGVSYYNGGNGVIRTGYVYCPGALNVTTGVYGGSETITNQETGLVTGRCYGRVDGVYTSGNLAVEEYGAVNASTGEKTSWSNSLIGGNGNRVSNSFTIGELQKVVWREQGARKVKVTEQYKKCGPVVNGAVSANTGAVQNNYYYTYYGPESDYVCNVPGRQERVTDAAIFQDDSFYDKTVNRTGQFELGDLAAGYFPRVKMSETMMQAQQRVPLVSLTADNSLRFLSAVIDEEHEKGVDGATEDYALATLLFRNRMGRVITSVEVEGLNVEPREGSELKQWAEDGVYKVEVKLTPDGTLFRSGYDVKSFHYQYYDGVSPIYVSGRQIMATFYKDVTQENWLRAFNDLKGYYRLAEDIDFEKFAEADRESAAGVLAANNTSFKGCIDGRGHSLKGFTFKRYPYLIRDLNEGFLRNLYVEDMTLDGISSSADRIGLIGECNNNAEVRNVVIKNAYVTGVKQSMCGALAGYVNTGTIQDCVVAGVTMQSGVNARNLEIGALVGRTTNSRVTNCFVRGLEMNVKEAGSLTGAGGLIGRIYSGSVAENIYAQGSIESGYANAGGLAGNLYGRVTAGWSKVNINSSAAYVGGIVGYIENSNQATCTLAVGEVYTRATDHYGRIAGGYIGTDNRRYIKSYAAARQKINSEVRETDVMDAAGLLSNEELRQKIIYDEEINLGDAFDYSAPVERNCLPLLYNAAGTALLPEQIDIGISTEGIPMSVEGIAEIKEDKKESGDGRKVDIADYELELVLTLQTKDLATLDDYQKNYTRYLGENYKNLSIEDMEFIETEDPDNPGKMIIKPKDYAFFENGEEAGCKLTFQVRALKYVDSYRVVLKTDDGQNGAKLIFKLKKDGVVGEETPLYRFIYRVNEEEAAWREYSDGRGGTFMADPNSWQGAMRVAGSGFENFRIMDDLDFAGITGQGDLQRELKIGRLEGDKYRIDLEAEIEAGRTHVDVKEKYLMADPGESTDVNKEDRFVEIRNLTYAESNTMGTCWIGELNGEMKYLRFRNISCTNSNGKTGNDVGLIKNLSGKASYLDIIGLKLNYGNATNYAGFIARAQDLVEYVRGRDIQVNGNQVSKRGVNYIGGIIGHSNGGIRHIGVKGTETGGTYSYSVNGGARDATSGDYNGGIVGYARLGVIFCYADTVEVTGNRYVGGIGTGYSDTIHNMYPYGTNGTTQYTPQRMMDEGIGYTAEVVNSKITGRNNVGGVYGHTYHYTKWGLSKDNVITAEVSGAGGMIGTGMIVYASTVIGCDIHAEVSNAGGVSGYSTTSDYTEVAYCNIWSDEKAGGISGESTSWGTAYAYVHDCAIYAGEYAGGIYGRVKLNSTLTGSLVQHCYIGRRADRYPHVEKTGDTYALNWTPDTSGSASNHVGGLAGYSEGFGFYNCVVDDDVVVSAWDFGGGFVGEGGGGNSINLEGAATVEVANSYAGGYAGRLIGYAESGTRITKVSRSIIAGSVKGKDHVGGFAGGYSAGLRQLDPETGSPLPDEETGYEEYMTKGNFTRIVLAMSEIQKTDNGSAHIGVIMGDAARGNQDEIGYLRVYGGTKYDNRGTLFDVGTSAIMARTGWNYDSANTLPYAEEPYFVTTADMKNIDLYYGAEAKGGLQLLDWASLNYARRDTNGNLVEEYRFRNFLYNDEEVGIKGLFPYVTANNNWQGAANKLPHWGPLYRPNYPDHAQNGIPIPDDGAVTYALFRADDVLEQISIYASGADSVNLEFPSDIVMEEEEEEAFGDSAESLVYGGRSDSAGLIEKDDESSAGEVTAGVYGGRRDSADAMAADNGSEGDENGFGNFGMMQPICYFRIYDGNGKLLHGESITRRVYTIPYDYQTTLTVKVTAGQSERSYALTGEGLRHTVMTYGNHCYYLKSDGIYRDKGAIFAVQGDAGESVGTGSGNAENSAAENNSVKISEAARNNMEKIMDGAFIHLYQGKALDESGHVYNVGSGKEAGSVERDTLFIPAQETKAAYETEFDGDMIKTYRMFSETQGSEDASYYRLFAKNGKLFGVDPELDQPYGQNFQSFVADYYSTSQGSAEYMSRLTENMVLKDYMTPICWPTDEKNQNILDNFRIYEVGDNLNASEPYVILRYQDNTAAAFNYLTGSLLFIDDSEKKDIGLIEYADMWLKGKKESLNVGNAYLNASALVGSLVSNPIDDSLIVNYIKAPNDKGGKASEGDKVIDIATDGKNKIQGENSETGNGNTGGIGNIDSKNVGTSGEGGKETGTEIETGGKISAGTAESMTEAGSEGGNGTVGEGESSSQNGNGTETVVEGSGAGRGTEATVGGSGAGVGTEAAAEGSGAGRGTEATAGGSGTGRGTEATAGGSGAGRGTEATAGGSGTGRGTEATAGGSGAGRGTEATAGGSGTGRGTEATAGGSGTGRGTEATAGGSGAGVGTEVTADGEKNAGESGNDAGKNTGTLGGSGVKEDAEGENEAGTAVKTGGESPSLTSDKAYVTMLTAEAEGYEVFRASELLSKKGTVILSENQKIKLLEANGLLQNTVDLESMKLTSEENRTGLLLVGAAAVTMLLLLGLLYYKKRKM